MLMYMNRKGNGHLIIKDKNNKYISEFNLYNNQKIHYSNNIDLRSSKC